MKRKFFLVTLSFFILLAISVTLIYWPALNCPSASYDLVGTQWMLTSLNGKTPVKESYSSDLGLEFGPVLVSGHGGCALLILDYTLNGAKINLHNPDFRYIACPEPINSQENEYLRSLQRAACVQVVDDQLILTGPWTELIYDRESNID